MRSKRAATARRMVCSVFKTVSGGRQETPRQQRLLHSMSEKIDQKNGSSSVMDLCFGDVRGEGVAAVCELTAEKSLARQR